MTEVECTRYDRLPPLAGLYLEDSFVLTMAADETSVSFGLDLVLTRQHPAYQSPRVGEQHCYRRAQISIDNARSVRWLRRTMRPFRDATGEVDYGEIDSWCCEGGVHRLRGDWGELEVDGGTVHVKLEAPGPDL